MRINKMKRLSRIICGTMLIAGATSVSAAPITYGSFAGTEINFDSLSASSSLGGGEALNTQFASSGVTFDTPNYSAHAHNGVLATGATLNSDPNVIWVDQDGGSGGSSAVGMNINFSSAQSQVGMWVSSSLGSTVTLSIYSGMALLESITTTLTSSTAWNGLEGFIAVSNSNITRATISSANSSGQNWNFSMDDLKFAGASVPEPGTLLLLSAGLAGVGFSRRKKSA